MALHCTTGTYYTYTHTVQRTLLADVQIITALACCAEDSQVLVKNNQQPQLTWPWARLSNRLADITGSSPMLRCHLTSQFRAAPTRETILETSL